MPGSKCTFINITSNPVAYSSSSPKEFCPLSLPCGAGGVSDPTSWSSPAPPKHTGNIQLCHYSLSAAFASPCAGAEVICSLSDCCLLIRAVTMGWRSWNTAQPVLHLFQLIFLSHFITTIYSVCLRKIELHCALGVGIWISLLFSSISVVIARTVGSSSNYAMTFSAIKQHMEILR